MQIKNLYFSEFNTSKQTSSSLLTFWTISSKASGVSAVGFWRTHEERRVCGVKRLRAKYCGGLQFCQQKQWLSTGVICLALPYGPHAGAGINERGDGPPGENTRTLDAGDLSPQGGCCARMKRRMEGKQRWWRLKRKTGGWENRKTGGAEAWKGSMRIR